MNNELSDSEGSSSSDNNSVNSEHAERMYAEYLHGDDYLDDEEEITISGGFLKLLLRICSNKDPDKTYLNVPGDFNPSVNHAKCLLTALKFNNTITSIDLSYSTLGDGGAIVLSAALTKMPMIKSLNLYKSNVGKRGAAALGKAFQNEKCAVNELDLSKNHIGDAGATCFAENIVALGGNISSLKELALSSNNISDEGAVALFKHLKVCTALEKINLGDNQISDKGVISFANDVIKYKNMKTLNLYDNAFGEKGVISLLKNFQRGSVAQNKTNMESLDMHCPKNKITDDGARTIAPLLIKLDPNITSIELAFGTLEGVRVIEQGVLQHNNYNILHFNPGSVNVECFWTSSGFAYRKGNEKFDFYLKLNRNGRKIMNIDKNDKTYPYLWTSLLSKRTINEEDPSPSMMYYFLRENPDLFECVHNNANGDDKSIQQKDLSGTKRKSRSSGPG